MKRYFGLFTKNQNSVVHSDDSMPIIEADVVNSSDNAVLENETTQVVEPEVPAVEESVQSTDADKPKRRSRKKTASSSPSDIQEVGDK